MTALVMLVSMLAPAVFLQQHWRRPKPARITYPRQNRARGNRVN